MVITSFRHSNKVWNCLQVSWVHFYLFLNKDCLKLSVKRVNCHLNLDFVSWLSNILIQVQVAISWLFWGANKITLSKAGFTLGSRVKRLGCLTNITGSVAVTCYNSLKYFNLQSNRTTQQSDWNQLVLLWG